jgi:homoserine O-succinyltransferase
LWYLPSGDLPFDSMPHPNEHPSRAPSASTSPSAPPRAAESPPISLARPSSRPPGAAYAKHRELSICLIDMNAGHVNQAMRCFRGIVTAFFDRVREMNPGLMCRVAEISPRDTNQAIPRDCDMYIGSGGPGSPYDGDAQPWFDDFTRFSSWMVDECRRSDEDQRSFFAVCYTFELLVRHFEVAEVSTRDSRKFGVMPIYTTPFGQGHPLLAPFRDRLFAFEHRNWEAVNTNERRLAELGGGLLAQESRDGHSKGRGLLGFDFGPGIEAVQFHPEADRAGVMSWVARPEQAAAFRATYGEETYQAMLRTLDDQNRLARTFALVIPGFLQRRFNALAAARGYSPIDAPSSSDVLKAFQGEAAATIEPPPPARPVEPAPVGQAANP